MWQQWTDVDEYHSRKGERLENQIWMRPIFLLVVFQKECFNMNPESFLWSYYYYTDCNEAVVIKILFICYIIRLCVGKIIIYRKYLHQKIMRQEE